MSDVFDIVARLGIDDHLLGPLRDIGREMESIAHQIGQATQGFYELGASVRGLGVAFGGIGAAGVLALDTVAKRGSEYLEVIAKMKISGMDLAQIQKAQAAAQATHLEVPTTMLTKNLELYRELAEITKGSGVNVDTLLTPIAKLQSLADNLGGEKTANIMKMFEILTGFGLSPQAAIERIGQESGVWAGGVVTPQQSLQTWQQMGELNRSMTKDFRNRVLPILEEEMPAGGRMSVGMGLRQLFREMGTLDKHGISPWRREMMQGQTIAGLGNDPYAFAQALAKGIEDRYQQLHGGRRVDLSSPEGLQLIHQLMERQKVTGAAEQVLTTLIQRGEVGQGAASPFVQARPFFDFLEKFKELVKDYGPVRAGMFSAIHDFIESIGVSVAKWELPKMVAITNWFNTWTTAIRAIPEEDMLRYVTIASDVVMAVGAFGGALLAIYGTAMLFSPTGMAAMGLLTLAYLGKEIYNNWDKNKTAIDNLSDINKRWGDQAALVQTEVNKMLTAFVHELTVYDYKSAFISVAVNIANSLARSLADVFGGSLLGNRTRVGTALPIVMGDPTVPRSGFLTNPKSIFNYLPSLPDLLPRRLPIPGLYPRGGAEIGPFGGWAGAFQGAPSFGDRFGSWGGGAVAPPASFRDRFWPSGGGAASPSSIAPGGGAISGFGGGQHQKSITIATNLNIDGRMLASIISEHIVGAGDTGGGTYRPGIGQFVAS